jgi:8-oxo-dGTP pyrophosphatase MutT (NUDIX family)
MAEKLVPRPAATLLLLRDGSLGPEAFLLQRTHSAAFLAGAHVFPGGALDKADRDGRLQRRVTGHTDAEASARSNWRARPPPKSNRPPRPPGCSMVTAG